MNIKQNIDKETVKKIFGSNKYVMEYLIELDIIKGGTGLKYKKITDITKLIDEVISTWDYPIALKIIRGIFVKTKKYANGKKAKEEIKILIDEWNRLNLGIIKWPCSQKAFDALAQRINNSFEPDKDKAITKAAIQFRRMKELNTKRNDFLETLIFEKNGTILPTLTHKGGTDYFIDGESFDQKVAKSPTNEFVVEYGTKYREIAINHPEIVAKFLYENQDEGRFGADSRLLIVYIDDDVSPEKIEEIINQTDLNNPIEIKFTYQHEKVGEKDYKVKCFVIILSND